MFLGWSAVVVVVGVTVMRRAVRGGGEEWEGAPSGNEAKYLYGRELRTE